MRTMLRVKSPCPHPLKPHSVLNQHRSLHIPNLHSHRRRLHRPVDVNQADIGARERLADAMTVGADGLPLFGEAGGGHFHQWEWQAAVVDAAEFRPVGVAGDDHGGHHRGGVQQVKKALPVGRKVGPGFPAGEVG